jgi:hypothetical protein
MNDSPQQASQPCDLSATLDLRVSILLSTTSHHWKRSNLAARHSRCSKVKETAAGTRRSALFAFAVRVCHLFFMSHQAHQIETMFNPLYK